ncbi:MAG: hypothetical protein Q8P30_02310 [Candidatus Uhrbacteria bacterium]|nr:hypothetical protein [Candidatus Uhrbacteria bacterium]
MFGGISKFRTFVSSTNWLYIAVIIATFALGALYIWQVNVSATRGFAMRDLDHNIEDLRLQNERLHMEVAKLQSIDSVSTRVQMLGLTQVKSIEYVAPNEPTVAVNR